MANVGSDLRAPKVANEARTTKAANRKPSPKFLSGWKEIARYLGKGVRTVQRYERDLGFPVRRPAGRPRGAVIATKAEIDAWVAATPIRDEFQLSRTQTSAQLMVLNEIKGKMATMFELRDQMRALRAELRASTQNLSDSIARIHKEVSSLAAPAQYFERLNDGSAHRDRDMF